MSLKEFDKAFGIKTSLEEEKRRFVNRIEIGIFDFYKNDLSEKNVYSPFFKQVCFQLGIYPEEYSTSFGNYYNLKFLTTSDFIKTLRTIVAIYQCGFININERIDNIVSLAIEKSNINLGIKWANGVFYPTGDELLDKELIDTSLQLLEGYPNEKKDLKNALDNYYSKSLYGVVENCYLTVEGLGRSLLGNSKTLIDNKPELLKILEFSPYWTKIFANYLNYANEYRRHAGEDRHNLKKNEVEAFLYLTCLIIRASLSTIQSL